ncbi:MAG: sigma-70 family RNA polymerase sigma factor [Planctomycetes bacterium]|nr:sigma-70 family RNA polymerase sigma factor [Planctomycetota bacterium]
MNRPPPPERPEPDDLDLTVLIQRSTRGDERAADQVFAAVHDELHHIARGKMAGERADHTLQATALVNEAWLRLLPKAPRDYADRGEFFKAAARVMRHVLVDHARARQRDKRGGKLQRRDFEVVLEHWSREPLDAARVIDLHDALAVLERVQPRAARALELHVFVGLTVAETASVLDVAESTVDLDLRAARAWLAERLGG